MKQPQKMLQRIADLSDLSAETLPKLPLVEIAGDRRVLLENHKGVTAFGHNRICVRVTFGIVEICGEGLRIVCMTKHQLIISGRINNVTLVRGDGHDS